jgi:hypothetical protein
MFNKLFIFLLIFLVSMTTVWSNVASSSKRIELSPTAMRSAIEEVNALTKPERLLLFSLKEALKSESPFNDLDPKIIVEKIEVQNKDQKKQLEELKKMFLNTTFLTPQKNQNNKEDTSSSKGTIPKMFFQYEVSAENLKSFFASAQLNESVPLQEKTLFLLLDINIDKQMSWLEVGVTKSENFVDVIKNSWQKWALEQFKNYPKVVIINQDIKEIPTDTHKDSVVLKWSSQLKKVQQYNDKMSALYEANAQYSLNHLVSGNVLLSFDFPIQRKEVTIADNKQLSSSLASLIYNMLNSQTTKIATSLDTFSKSKTIYQYSFLILGEHGLLDVRQIAQFLNEQFAQDKMNASMKNYEALKSTITLRSELTEEQFVQKLQKMGAAMTLNEQKILTFSPETKAFAIIPKNANN